MIVANYRRIVVLPDIHTPNEQTSALESIFSFVKFYKPDLLIQLGDFCDWDSVTRYDPRRESDIIPIDQEIDAANTLLDRIDKVAGRKCDKLMIGGNHEDRYESFRINQGMLVGIRRMKDLTSWSEEYNLRKRGWDVKEYGEWVQVGKIIFTHGWYASANAAKKMAEAFPGRNVIFGHTHRHVIHGCLDHNDLPIEAESIGTLSKFNLSYLKGRPPVDWIHAFMYIDMKEDGTFSKHFVRIINNGFIEFGREFTARI